MKKNIYQTDYHKKYSQELIARKHLLDYVSEKIQIKGKNVLDAGCNGGFMSFYMSSMGAKKVYGIDMSPGFIQKNNKRVLKEKLNSKLDFRVGDVEKLPYRDSFFDFIICSEVIEHINHPKNLAAEFYRVLKPGGQILVTTPNILNPMEILHNLKHIVFWFTNKEEITHIQHFTYNSLDRVFKRFKDKNVEGIGIGAAFLPFSGFSFVKKIDYLMGNLLKPIAFDLFLTAKKK